MKAGRIDLTDIRFTFDEVYQIIGEKVDLVSKYETDDLLGATLLIDDKDSEEMQEYRVAAYAQRVADVSTNGLVEEQRKRLFHSAMEKGAVEWL